jgi:protein TonB
MKLRSPWHVVVLALATTLPAFASPSSKTAPSGDLQRSNAEEMSWLQAQQHQLLNQIYRDVARLLPLSKPDPDEAPEITQQRSRHQELLRSLKEIEARINAESPIRTRFLNAAVDEPAFGAYYQRLCNRIEAYGAEHFPEDDGTKLYGRITVQLTIATSGKVDSVEILESPSRPLANKVEALLRELAPYEAFPSDIANRVDRMVFIAKFNFSHQD